MSTLFDLGGTTAVVTGARRGIGMGMALALADAGADIIAASAYMEPDGGDVGAMVRSRGRLFEGHRVDFADRPATQVFAELLTSRRVDVLVNNAGTIERAPAAEHPLPSWDRVLEVNLSSGFVLSQAVAPQMAERRRGKIIFTASLLSFQGGINVPGYAAAKSAIAGLTRALSNEWFASGINVNAIAPGYIATDNTQALREDAQRHDQILDRIPAERWGKPSDLGGATVFLSSRASDYVGGVVLPVDGGWLAR